MNKWLKILIQTIMTFVVFILLDYLFFKEIDWSFAVIVSIIFAMIDIISEILKNKSK